MSAASEDLHGQYGRTLIDATRIDDARLDQLFLAALLSVIGVWFAANLLLQDMPVAIRSARITLVCLGICLIFYVLSRKMGLLWGLMLTYGLMLLLVYSRQAWMIPVIQVLAGLSLVYALRFLRVEGKGLRDALLMGAIATAAILATVAPDTTFNMVQRAHNGSVQLDTWFHVSIAAMIKNYGLSSTGLNGLVHVPYYVMSHALMASISLLSGESVLEVYGVAPWVFFSVVLILALTALPAMLDRSSRLSMPLAWCIACLALVFIPTFLGYWFVMDGYMTGESYLVSLAQFVLALSLLFKRKLSGGDLLLALLLTLTITATKASVGIVFVGLWFARLLFLRSGFLWRDLGAIAICAVTFLWLTHILSSTYGGIFRFRPLSLINQYSLGGWAVYVNKQSTALQLAFGAVAAASFFLMHFLLNWLLAVRDLCQVGWRGMLRSPVSIYCLASALPGCFVTLLFELPQGAHFYFTNVALFVALPCCIGIAALAKAGVTSRQTAQALVLGALLIGIYSTASYEKISALPKYALPPVRNELVDRLIELRASAPKDIVLQATDAAAEANPSFYCIGKPLVYPALSERAWADVISDIGTCSYVYYGFERYGIDVAGKKLAVPPVLLPGMRVEKP